jgi:LysR family glycine cleavage system transcriptional activator
MRLPNLNGLRAFEAAARLLSMKHAGAELHVTPSAVSQQIRALESELGVALFRRGHRALSLTSAGQTLLPAVRDAFRLIAEVGERVRRDPDARVTISATSFFAEAWLVPRLPRFSTQHPEIDLHIVNDVALASLGAGEADVAIRHGVGHYPGMQSDLLMAPAVIPVAAPKLVDRLGLPTRPEELLGWPKVHDGDRGAWPLWFADQRLVGAEISRGPSFDDAGLLRAAILGGHGAGLLPRPLVENLIADGALVAVGPEASIATFAYYLVVPKAHLNRPRVAMFRRWLIEEAARLDSAL